MAKKYYNKFFIPVFLDPKPIQTETVTGTDSFYPRQNFVVAANGMTTTTFLSPSFFRPIQPSH